MNQIKPDIITVMTDYLALSGLGAFGHTAAETPSFDRLAMESVLFDRYYTLSPDLAAAYRAYWYAENGESLAKQADRAGYETILVTDSPEIAQMPGSELFHQTFLLPYQKPISEPVETAEETAIYRFFDQTAQIYAAAKNAGKPVFLWAHTAGFGGVWDFPHSLRELFVEDEEDPQPYRGTTPPYAELFVSSKRRKTAAEEAALPDYDRICAVTETYAAGISVWDRGLEAFLESLAVLRFFENGELILGSVRGFSLGEHGRVGLSPDGAPVFYAEELHIPLLVRFPGIPDGAYRTGAVCDPTDLYRMLAADFTNNFADNEENCGLKDLAMDKKSELKPYLRLAGKSDSADYSGLITPEWFLRVEKKSDGTESVELYVRPDDRHDVNDVASRCPDTCAELLRELKK